MDENNDNSTTTTNHNKTNNIINKTNKAQALLRVRRDHRGALVEEGEARLVEEHLV